ncbi:unnamed protein product [Prunus armeniaca]|uniref:CCHC-type domain-containing protein n=1 Tax=Prunus armeniaca TaxID=36596 RepID=A0A6J5VFW0_PRUAR|nr:unnamed protein product [Prunus armeniaca]
MLWSELIQGTSVRCQCMSDLLAFSTSLLTHMEDISSAFSHRFVLTDVEQQEIVIESKENIGVKTDKFFLKPKAHVTIVELEQNRFFFAFNTNLERATILNGGPWLFNGYLLILAEADEKVNLTRIPLVMQEFWIQVKGLPLSFMTRAMGQMIGTALGGYVVTDQSKKVDCLGSYLRIRARIDVTKPLRRSLNLRLDGDLVEVEIRYEKLPITCYHCGLIGHMEGSCTQKGVVYADDKAKPYGKWFQQDVLGPDYRRPSGRRFGLSPSTGWSMRAPDKSGFHSPA